MEEETEKEKEMKNIKKCYVYVPESPMSVNIMYCKHILVKKIIETKRKMLYSFLMGMGKAGKARNCIFRMFSNRISQIRCFLCYKTHKLIKWKFKENFNFESSVQTNVHCLYLLYVSFHSIQLIPTYSSRTHYVSFFCFERTHPLSSLHCTGLSYFSVFLIKPGVCQRKSS